MVKEECKSVDIGDMVKTFNKVSSSTNNKIIGTATIIVKVVVRPIKVKVATTIITMVINIKVIIIIMEIIIKVLNLKDRRYFKERISKRKRKQKNIRISPSL